MMFAAAAAAAAAAAGSEQERRPPPPPPPPAAAQCRACSVRGKVLSRRLAGSVPAASVDAVASALASAHADAGCAKCALAAFSPVVPLEETAKAAAKAARARALHALEVVDPEAWTTTMRMGTGVKERRVVVSALAPDVGVVWQFLDVLVRLHGMIALESRNRDVVFSTTATAVFGAPATLSPNVWSLTPGGGVSAAKVVSTVDAAVDGSTAHTSDESDVIFHLQQAEDDAVGVALDFVAAVDLLRLAVAVARGLGRERVAAASRSRSSGRGTTSGWVTPAGARKGKRSGGRCNPPPWAVSTEGSCRGVQYGPIDGGRGGCGDHQGVAGASDALDHEAPSLGVATVPRGCGRHVDATTLRTLPSGPLPGDWHMLAGFRLWAGGGGEVDEIVVPLVALASEAFLLATLAHAVSAMHGCVQRMAEVVQGAQHHEMIVRMQRTAFPCALIASGKQKTSMGHKYRDRFWTTPG